MIKQYSGFTLCYKHKKTHCDQYFHFHYFYVFKAADLEAITGNYSYMRYPDAVAGNHQIPSEMFDCKMAEKAVEITKRILDMTAELID